MEPQKYRKDHNSEYLLTGDPPYTLSFSSPEVDPVYALEPSHVKQVGRRLGLSDLVKVSLAPP